jgi:hypothetical protein
LTDQRQYAPGGTLQGERKSCLHTNNRLKIATLLQLHQYLIFTAYLLRLVSLRQVEIHQIGRQPPNIYLF